jgi:hypothetical protein
MLSVTYADFCSQVYYAKCCFAEYRYAKCHFAEGRYVKWHHKQTSTASTLKNLESFQKLKKDCYFLK